MKGDGNLITRSPFPCLSVTAEGLQTSCEGLLISNFAQPETNTELLEHSPGFFAWRRGPIATEWSNPIGTDGYTEHG